MREDADVEVRAEQVLVAQTQHSKELEELRAQVAALMAKTAELQYQSTRAPRPKVCYWCEQPGHFQQDCVEIRPTAAGPSSLLQTPPSPATVRRSAAQCWTTLSIPPGKLEVPVVRTQTTGDMNPVGMIGRCPTVDIVRGGWRKICRTLTSFP